MDKMQVKKILKENDLFLEIMQFVEFTSKKYSDNKEQFQLRIEGVLKDASKAGEDVGFIDLTRAKISEDDVLGCRDKMIVVHRKTNLKKVIIKAIFLMKCVLNNVDPEEVYKECEAYKINQILSKSNISKKSAAYSVNDEDLMIIFAEYISKHIEQYKKIKLEVKLNNEIIKYYNSL
ncbi:MAG: hypothetical protein E7184_03700 [Erysipelotrichaceae bacterium]|nr:hypothetical protein [Erysipelotrichaceae bacterium]